MIERILKSRARIVLAVAAVLALIAWGRLTAMGVSNPSPFRELKANRPEHLEAMMTLSCSGTSISQGARVYRTDCINSTQFPSNFMRLDMARGVIDEWPLSESMQRGLTNDLSSFKVATDGSVTMTFAATSEFTQEAVTYTLEGTSNKSSSGPADNASASATPIGPGGEPASISRMAAEIGGDRWIAFQHFDYSVDPAGKISAAEVWTGHSLRPQEQDKPGDLQLYNIVPLGDRYAFVGLRYGQDQYSPGSIEVIDDQSGDVVSTVPVYMYVPSFGYLFSAPDAAGGLWVFSPSQMVAHFDSSLHRTDGLNVFERLERLIAGNFRLYDLRQMARSIDVYSPDFKLIKQLAIPALLLGLPIGLLIGWGLWRRKADGGAFAASPQAMWASGVYIVLFAAFIYWYWQMTAVF